jgi:hypothetical protein
LSSDSSSRNPFLRRRSLLKAGSLVPALGAVSLLSACGGGGSGANGFGAPAPIADAPTPPPDAPPPVASTKVSSFGLAVLPDTQFYSRYATEETGNQFNKRFGSTPYVAQTQWLADNAARLKIPFVIHVGDIVDQVNKPQQWDIADKAMKVLEDKGLPYSILAGNHDVLNDIGYEGDQSTGTDAQRDLAAEPYLKWFGATRAQKQGTFGGRDPSGFHEYHIFTAESQKFLVLSLSWRVSDAGIEWAKSVLKANPTLPVILVNHQLIAIAGDGIQPLEVSYGLMLWEKLIKSNDQIFMTVNGHHHGSANKTKINDFGNAVEEMVVDYQMAYQGGNGLLRFYEFDLTNNQIKALSFSPWVRQKPAATLNDFDQVMLRDSNNEFVIKMDFAKRFARFAPNFKAADPSVTALTVAATSMMLDGFKAIETAPVKAPANADDYPHVPETVAHWRFFGGTVGTALADGQVIADVSGNGSTLTRAALNAPPGNTAQLADLQWSGDRHRLSSAPGCIQFSNTDASHLSYFMTDAAAAMNGATFETTGYTIEAFIKLDETWTTKNAWMNIMTRGGWNRNFPGFQGWDASPPVQFAISNLKEVQFEVIPQKPAPTSARANWSGEILLDSWLHIAVVNDPVTMETTMYVEGAPILRNTVNTVGLATQNLPWVVGAGYYQGNGPNGGFLGAMGEIRIVSKPLPPSQWLTARAAG